MWWSFKKDQINMKCRFCGKEFISLYSSVCPYCGADNDESLFDSLFSPIENNKKKNEYDPCDMEDPDNYSDDEYMDDDDYDDFDN